MNDLHTWIYASSAALVAALTLIFIVVFWREPWRKHPFGQSVMVLSFGILLLSCLGLAVYIWGPDYRFREVAVVGGRTLIAVGMAQRLLVLVRAQRRDRTRSLTPERSDTP